MNSYETLYIISAQLDEEKTKASVEKFSGIIEKNGGTIKSCDEWGKRKLAYPINFQNEGYYVLTTFDSDGELPKELERNFGIDEDIMRYIVVRLDD